MFTRQTVRTVWEGCVSDEFSANNGVRQGGVLSPVLFTLYIDVILNRLEQSGLGCYVAHEYFGALCSADDLALLAPNFACLKSMIQLCESFAQEFDLLFNATKTVCILFSDRTRHSGDPPPLYVNNVMLKWTESAKHLGSIVSHDLKENEEINHKRNDFIGRANSVISNFKHVDKMCLQGFLCHNAVICLDLKPGNWIRSASKVSAQLGVRQFGSSGVCPTRHA